MKKSILLVGMPSLLLGAVAVFGQGWETKAISKVPFDFVVGSTVLPAGDYAIRTVTDDPQCLLIQNTQTCAAAFARSRDILLSPPGSTAPSPKLVFAHGGNRYVLHQLQWDNHVHDLIHGTEIAELPRTSK